MQHPEWSQLFERANAGGKPLVGVVADSGQIARLAVRGGAHFLLALSAGVYRNQGLSPLAASLPFGNSNDLTENLAHQHVLPGAGDTPVITGNLDPDPTCPLDERLGRWKAWGIAGVTNYPSVSLLDGTVRALFEEEGHTIDAELAMLAAAKQRGLLTVGFVAADAAVAARFAAAGVDALILTPGLTRYLEESYERRDQLQLAIRRLNDSLQAARSVSARLVCLAFGGPITMPEDLEQLYRQSPFDGFVGGSVFGRLPVESSVLATLRRFQSVQARQGSAEQSGLGPMVGGSPAMQRLFRLIERAARCEFNVCIEGESGVGKELVATQIHRLSSRAHGPLVTLNCGAIPATLLESELFGHEKGAFTGADRRRLGKVELADKGTLFLDEIGDLSPHGQVALLRVIQQREITRIGGNTSIQVDQRIVSASNQPLARLVERGRFRADLYYRLNQLTLTVPPLRERLDDLPLLLAPILESLRVQMNVGELIIDGEFYAKLLRHAWPGNLRELQHVIYQAALLEDGAMLQGSHFVPTESRDGTAGVVDTDRRQQVAAALARANGNKSVAAKLLGVSRKTLYGWMRELRLNTN